ncbi:MAG TPA: D-tyrosyl-tRNA(Tyr) deacylase, partial [Phycisphaerales bacterium]|nr:D-tyrosyl-tRNA(Tyr) deacylase [Phycisphaerales bacterium]
MRMVCQRVSQAKVEVNDQVVGEIERGLLVYLGVGKCDAESDAQF